MKTALIVDDSRLAQTVLSRLLAEHGVAADTAPTAEAALDYLKGRRPDVVFLDHMMPGMDGFEALEVMKANPVMATIPVMMYTSEEGELYVSRARALGALGVLPKSLQPAEMTKVLHSLHLISRDTPESAREEHKPEPAPATDTRRMRELIEELFYEQATTLRDEIRRELKHVAAALPPPAQTIPPVEKPYGRRALQITSVLLLALAVGLGYFYYRASALLSEANERTEQLATDATALTAANTQASPLGAPRTASADPSVLDVLEWAANRSGNFPFGAVPLDDERARGFASLFDSLERIGFTGTVAIDVHVGRFCMDYGPDGNLQLAPPGQPVAECAQLGWPELEAIALGKRQSVVFANAVAETARRGRLRVETVSHGTAEPAVDYPSPSYDVTAGAWNAIAASNQRIGVRLLPDPGADASN